MTYKQWISNRLAPLSRPWLKLLQISKFVICSESIVRKTDLLQIFPDSNTWLLDYSINLWYRHPNNFDLRGRPLMIWKKNSEALLHWGEKYSKGVPARARKKKKTFPPPPDHNGNPLLDIDLWPWHQTVIWSWMCQIELRTCSSTLRMDTDRYTHWKYYHLCY